MTRDPTQSIQREKTAFTMPARQDFNRYIYWHIKYRLAAFKFNTMHHSSLTASVTRWLFLSIILLTSWPLLAANDVQILAIHSYSQEYPWTAGQHRGFVDHLEHSLDRPVTIETEHLDTKRIPFDALYIDNLTRFLQHKYRDFHPDALYVTDDNALIFAINNLREMFPNTPVFFSGVNDYSAKERLDQTRETGVYEKKEIGPNLDLFQSLFGDYRQIIVVGDNSTTFHAIKRELNQELMSRPDLLVSFIVDNRIEQLTQKLQQAPPAPVLLTTLGAIQDASGNTLNLEDSIGRITSISPRPVFSMEDAYLIKGVVGGFVTSGPAQGQAAAALLLSYLGGTPISELPAITQSPNEYVFDDIALQSQSLKLPPSIELISKILHPRQNFYQANSKAIISVLLLLAVLFITSLMFYALQASRKNRILKKQSEQLEAQGKKLQESEEKYRLLFELSEDPMLVIHDHDFVMANNAAGRLLGYSSVHELQQIHPSRLSPQYQPDGQLSEIKADDMMDRAYEKGYHRFEWEHLKKNGESLLIEVSLTRIPFEDGFALLCMWRDITEWRTAELSLREKSTYLNSILSASVKVGFIATDQDLLITYYNDTSAEIFDLKPDALNNQSIHFFHELESVGPDKRILMALKQAEQTGEYRFSINRMKEGGAQYIDARISPIWDDSHQLKGYMLMAEDVTRQREAEELIKFQASYDHLTNLPNRRTLLDRLRQTLSRCERHHHQGAVMFIDLDNFKQVNDTLGHSIGDTLLKQVAKRMQASVRSEDTVARLGGDEFVILLTEIGDNLENSVNDATLIAEKLLKEIARPYTIEGHEIRSTTSMGISIFPTQHESADDILRQADTAMYQAKDAGRNNFKFFSPSMQQKVEARMNMLEDLHRAVEREEFIVYYQPQVDRDGRIIGVESLVRWQHPENGLVMPDQFIGLAEESGLIEAISEFVLRESLKTHLQWSRLYPDSTLSRVAVNVSAIQFQKDNFVDNIMSIVKQSANDPRILTLELTESMLLHNVDTSVEKMQQLGQQGIRFSIDDFGTGYSSLAYLKRLPIAEIKIDRSFVKDIMVDPNDLTLVKTILSLARQMNLEAVAEGVETSEIRDQLLEYGCQHFQGYYFSKPLPAMQFEQELLGNARVFGVVKGVDTV